MPASHGRAALRVARLLQDLKVMREAGSARRSSGATAPATTVMRPRALWLHWVGANALGELAGLGAVGVVVAALASQPWSPPPLLLFAGMVALGAMEGAVVGVAQWLVVRQVLSALRARPWIAATALGAAAAWALGMPLVFRIAGSAPPEGVTAPFVAEALVWIAVVGGVVGAVHGLVLVRLVVPRRLGLAVPPADRRRDR